MCCVEAVRNAAERRAGCWRWRRRWREARLLEILALDLLELPKDPQLWLDKAIGRLTSQNERYFFQLLLRRRKDALRKAREL